jgi:hypothetical protein
MSTEEPAAMRPQNSEEESVANMEGSIDGTARAGGMAERTEDAGRR